MGAVGDAALGDARCGFDMTSAGYVASYTLRGLRDGTVLEFDETGGFEAGWFERVGDV